MKLHVDLIHPANIHYFKHFINEMKEKEHEIIITARNKDVLQHLLINYNYSFIDSGKGSIGRGALGKAFYLMVTTIKYFFLYLLNKPDYVLSFGSTPCAFASSLLSIPHIAFEDTEHANLNRKLYAPFTDFVGTPLCFYEAIGEKQFKFDGYMELFYLHKNRFAPNIKVLDELGLNKEKDFVFLRFVSWGAFHDIGEKGVSKEDKIKIVKKISKTVQVVISSEGDLPEELKEYELSISPEKIHDVLAFAKLYIGEGGTMASECAMLGVPSIYINSLPLMGYLREAENVGLLYHLQELDDIINTIDKILSLNSKHFKENKKKLLDNTIDPTALLVWLIENYPESRDILKSNPDYQYKFK
jgi:uncharacterized protein